MLRATQPASGLQTTNNHASTLSKYQDKASIQRYPHKTKIYGPCCFFGHGRTRHQNSFTATLNTAPVSSLAILGNITSVESSVAATNSEEAEQESLRSSHNMLTE